MTHDDCPDTCDACGAPQRNYREHAYPRWQFYECGRRYSPDLKEWAGVAGHIYEPACLRRQLATAIEQNERQGEAMKQVALAIGDRTHGAMASECQEWRETLERTALVQEKPK